MSKYEPLRKYLDTATLTLSYDEIEEILGFKLPQSAYIHDAWWDNSTKSHTQTHGWIESGWIVVEKQLGVSITFQKRSSEENEHKL
ncbi:hypothetical protein [Paenibacillus sp. sgz500992]|uniref:DUF7662 domain-containing protein n=1 Tax=Paenibacillus sp. sgz500992 TaxID=3242476 RepID=UPI0036D43C23